ncbi:hypothetical protein LOK49_LG13G01811 [Camellia lanceoleosa]|uniref:Uncharacterized protein n=1 Tax=Camellia lanceoleosa TaxID=1840588 RepID=A0ACC0FF12_9ERIC|nr:hypothetical protein LOK49_LG13G01811 [Camellia lanceoleosa]
MRLERRPTDPTRADLEASPAEEEEEKKENEEEEEEEDEVQHAQGRTLAQSGQRLVRRSRRQVGQIPLLRRFEGCFGHFHTSSSSA